MTADPTGRFSHRVSDYVRGRPGYPDKLIEHLLSGVPGGVTIADIGAGSGILTARLAGRGHPVVAVEPDDAMRRAASEVLEPYDSCRVIEGTGEATGLAAYGVGLITVAQAFHWMDRRRARDEFLRILSPAGQVALIWNDRRDDGSPLMQAYEDLLRTHGTDYHAVDHRRVDRQVLGEWFGGGMEQRCFEYRHRLDREGLVARVLSCSYVPARDEPGSGPLLSDIGRLFSAHQRHGLVEFLYDTRLFAGRPA